MRLTYPIFLLLVLTSFSFSQSLDIGINGGIKQLTGNTFYSKPLGRPGIYYENGTETWYKGLDFKTELSYAITLNYFFEDSPFGLCLDFSYSPFRGKGIWEDVSQDITDPDSPFITVEVETKMDFYSLGIGGNYWFHLNDFNPYITFQFLFNYMGELRHYVESIDFETTVNQYGSRYGIRIGGGIRYQILEKFGLNGHFSFDMNNLLKRHSGEEKLNTLTILFGISYNLL